LVNGDFVSSTFSFEDKEKIKIKPLKTVLKDKKDFKKIRDYFTEQQNSLASLNHALVHDGIFLEIEDNYSFKKPLIIYNFFNKFSEKFGVPIMGRGGAMTSATNRDGLSIINYGMGSANAATIMDLLSGIHPKGVLFLGKCGGLKKSAELGHFILPIAAIRGEGTSNDYFPIEVPAMPSFKLHKHVSSLLVEKGIEYRTGVIYTTNRRVWEHDEEFKQYLGKVRAIGIDMETATIFITGFANGINRGALLLVSDTPMAPEGVKTEESDKEVTRKYVDLHINMGIEAMTRIGEEGETIKHFSY